MKYLENAYDIVKNVYELGDSSTTFDFQIIIYYGNFLL